jgi:hypothetical protein
MPVEIVNFEQKKYIIDGAEFKLRPPTIGIKRRGSVLNEILSIKAQELVAIGRKYNKQCEEYDSNDESACKELSELAEKIGNIHNEVYVKAEAFLRIVLEPVNPEDNEKLIADNLDDEIVTQVQQDFFQHAGLLTVPANNYKKRSRS